MYNKFTKQLTDLILIFRLLPFLEIIFKLYKILKYGIE
jgi:hypothetical protein